VEISVIGISPLMADISVSVSAPKKPY